MGRAFFGGDRVWLALVLAVMASMSWVATSWAEDPAGDDVVEAVWKAHNLNFEYRGYSTRYTCGGLRDKLKAILKTVGAREDLTLRAYVCDDAAGIVRFQIAFESPVEATEDNVRALTQYDSRAQLAAKARGESLPGAADLVRFPATWKEVSFARDTKLRLTPGDCELVRQVRRDILPRLSVRVVSDDLHCSSSLGTIGKPRLSVSALVAVDAGNEKK